MNPIKVCVVEDDPMTRNRLLSKIDAGAMLSVAGAAESLETARTLLAEVVPDVLLVDLHLPDGDGTTLIEEQTHLRPGLPILVISVFGDEQRVVRAISAGAQGYLLKDDDSEEIAQAIEQMMQGQSPISPAIASHLIRHFQPARVGAEAPVSPLSERELEVLKLAAKGLTYQEAAELMGVTVNTVGTYTMRVYTKLAVNSRSEAIFEARQLGLMSDR